MPDAPMLDALLLADEILLNKLDGKYTAVGIFKCIMSPQFPFTQGSMALWGRLSDVWSDQHLFVSINSPSKESEYGTALNVQQIDIPGDKDRKIANGMKEFGGKLIGLQFHKPGRHMVVVATADGVIGHTSFEVVKIERAFVGG